MCLIYAKIETRMLSLIIIASLLAVCCSLLTGCSNELPPNNVARQRLVGEYELAMQGCCEKQRKLVVRETLQLLSDGTLLQKIMYKDGKTIKNRGKWKYWGKGYISLDNWFNTCGIDGPPGKIAGITTPVSFSKPIWINTNPDCGTGYLKVSSK
jgi:hypothetical protein